MKKVIVVIILFLIIPKALGQQDYDKQMQVRPPAYLSHRLHALNIDTITQVNYISMINCPQSIVPVKVLYIIDGAPDSFQSFEKLNPVDIINIHIINQNEAFYFCVPFWGIITIKTKKGLTKREARKLRRVNKRQACN